MRIELKLLFGRGETGKTRTLNHLREMLRKEGKFLPLNLGKDQTNGKSSSG